LGLLGLAACGDLPQPFRGQPGQVAARLARPPAYRIAIPPPAGALQTRAQAEAYAEALAEQLMAQEVPAVAGEPWPLDWVVEVSATRQPAGVVPHYRLRDGDGTLLGEASGRMVSTRDWLTGDEAALRRAAADGAQSLATLVARADALRRTGDERSAGAGPLVVRLLPVRGAPGDGNRSLTARMSEQLAALGFRVQEQSDGAQFAVQGLVEMAPGTRGQQRIEIVWTVQRRDGFDLGRVLQLNEVPAGSLNGLWGDVAFVVANEAAGGIRDVIANAEAAPPPAEAPQPAAATPAPAAPVAGRASRATPRSARR
jgi:hypothetical protein